MNHFYKLWVDAQNNRNNYIWTEVHWSEVPGRDVKWKEETIKNTSQRQFTQEFESLAHNTRININEHGVIYDIPIGELYDILRNQRTIRE